MSAHANGKIIYFNICIKYIISIWMYKSQVGILWSLLARWPKFYFHRSVGNARCKSWLRRSLQYILKNTRTPFTYIIVFYNANKASAYPIKYNTTLARHQRGYQGRLGIRIYYNIIIYFNRKILYIYIRPSLCITYYYNVYSMKMP